MWVRGFTALSPPVPLDNRLKAGPREPWGWETNVFAFKKEEEDWYWYSHSFHSYPSLLPLWKTLNGKHLSLALSCMISSLAGIQSKCFVMHCTGRPGEESISYTLITSVMKWPHQVLRTVRNSPMKLKCPTLGPLLPSGRRKTLASWMGSARKT